MKTKSLLSQALLLIFPLLIMAQQENKPTDICIPCEQLKSLELPDVRITESVTVTTGSSYCRVLGVIGREIKFELLLPLEWKGIFVMGGGGGFVGTVQNSARSYINSGYATAGTDTGHDSGKSPSASWAYNNMERQVNFGHLAIHRTAMVSKAIIQSYYGSGPKYSYFTGCSRGGGQAMMEAQRYPGDFDGIVAGAPAFNWPAIAAEFIQNTKAVYPEKLTESVLTRDNIRKLQEEVLKQCDMLDGARDSIIDDPRLCRVDLSAFPKCPGDKPGNGCFTSIQLNAIKEIYDGIDLGNGISYPGFPPGGENFAGGWITWITGPNENYMKSAGYPSMQAYFGIEMFRYLMLQEPEWDYTKYNFSGYNKEMKYASSYLDATSTDYSGFKNRKGKIILWHGWNDPALSAFATISHFDAVKAADPETGSFMRLYLLPGVLHCGGGYGAFNVDWIELMRDWVEKDKAPEMIIATKKSGGIEISKQLWPYPGEGQTGMMK